MFDKVEQIVIHTFPSLQISGMILCHVLWQPRYSHKKSRWEWRGFSLRGMVVAHHVNSLFFYSFFFFFISMIRIVNPLLSSLGGAFFFQRMSAWEKRVWSSKPLKEACHDKGYMNTTQHINYGAWNHIVPTQVTLIFSCAVAIHSSSRKFGLCVEVGHLQAWTSIAKMM